MAGRTMPPPGPPLLMFLHLVDFTFSMDFVKSKHEQNLNRIPRPLAEGLSSKLGRRIRRVVEHIVIALHVPGQKVVGLVSGCNLGCLVESSNVVGSVVPSRVVKTNYSSWSEQLSSIDGGESCSCHLHLGRLVFLHLVDGGDESCHNDPRRRRHNDLPEIQIAAAAINSGTKKGKKNDWCVREAIHGKGGPTIEGKGTYNCQGDWNGHTKWGNCFSSCVDGLKCKGGDSKPGVNKGYIAGYCKPVGANDSIAV